MPLAATPPPQANLQKRFWGNAWGGPKFSVSMLPRGGTGRIQGNLIRLLSPRLHSSALVYRLYGLSGLQRTATALATPYPLRRARPHRCPSLPSPLRGGANSASAERTGWPGGDLCMPKGSGMALCLTTGAGRLRP